MSDRVDRAAAVAGAIQRSKAFRAAAAFGVPPGADAECADLIARDLIDAGFIPASRDGRLDRVRVYQDEAGQYRWTRRAPNGEIVAQGEAHTRERDAYRAAARANTPDWMFDREAKD